jgi:hypothetical protein
MRDPVRDVGGVVVIPASHLSDYMTGRTLFVDGGRAYFRWGIDRPDSLRRISFGSEHRHLQTAGHRRYRFT